MRNRLLEEIILRYENIEVSKSSENWFLIAKDFFWEPYAIVGNRWDGIDKRCREIFRKWYNNKNIHEFFSSEVADGDRTRLEFWKNYIDKIKIDFEDDGEVLKLYPKISDDEIENENICKTILAYENINGDDFELAKNIYQKILYNKKFLNYKISFKERYYADNVKVIDKEEISKALEKYEILKKDIDIKNKKRYSYETLKKSLKYEYTIS